jgi:hypothetical protein
MRMKSGRGNGIVGRALNIAYVCVACGCMRRRFSWVCKDCGKEAADYVKVNVCGNCGVLYGDYFKYCKKCDPF